jgi:SAM-dependent methyltransferase
VGGAFVMIGMTVTTTNRGIWDRIYEGGSSLWYPAEALVRIVRRQEREGGFPGIILDHGCGSGNVAEFLVRCGYRVSCTDISPAALQSVERRFADLKLPAPPCSLIDLDRPLRSQLPAYDHVIAWQSLYYADISTVRTNISELIAGLSEGGVFILCLPTERDLAFRHSEAMAGGSRRLIDNVSGQQGAVLSIPDSAGTLRAWCAGVTVRDVVTYGMEFDGRCSEFYALYGVKHHEAEP